MSKTDSTKHKPYGFHEFLIVDLFDKVKAKTFNGGTGDLPSQKIGDYVLPMLSAGINNQGLNNYDTFEDDVSILKNVISISANGANTGAAFFQNQEFGILQDAYAIDFKDQNFDYTENIYLYVLSVINKKFKDKFSWTLKAGWNRVKELTIQLPVLANNQPDYEYMDYFVEELKHKYVEELDAWWSQAGFASLSDTLLTGNDQNIITKYQQAQFTQVPLSDMFNIINDKVKITDVDFDQYPEVLAQTANNGVAHSEFGQPSLLKGLTIGMRGSFNTYMHDSPFIIGPNVAGLQLKQSTRDDEAIYLYVSADLNKQYARFSGYTNYPTFTKLKNEVEITVPMTNDDLPDYDLISQYMQVMKKLTIQTHRAWLDEQLVAYQSLI